MSVAPTVQDFINDFQAIPARLSLASPLTEIKFIGDFYAQQMQQHAKSSRTIRDLVRHTRNLSRAAIRQLLAEYVKNQGANTCKANRGARYHVRDFNFVAFNSLRNVLEAARQLGLGRIGHAAALPSEFDAIRDASTASCSCYQTQRACQAGGAAGAATCRWTALPAGPQRAAVQGRPGVCNPVSQRRIRHGQVIGAAFPGLRRNEPGQKKRAVNQAADANQTFIGLWRVPD